MIALKPWNEDALLMTGHAYSARNVIALPRAKLLSMESAWLKLQKNDIWTVEICHSGFGDALGMKTPSFQPR